MSVVFFFFKQKTAYEMLISDWSSDVCSSDLEYTGVPSFKGRAFVEADGSGTAFSALGGDHRFATGVGRTEIARIPERGSRRSEEHTSELQSLMRISYAVFCLKKKNNAS